MYARITNLQFSPYRAAEVIDTTRQRIVTAAKQQKGFKGFWMLVDRSTGRMMAITLWEGEEDREVTGENSAYYRDGLALLVPFLAGEPSVEDLELVIQE